MSNFRFSTKIILVLCFFLTFCLSCISFSPSKIEKKEPQGISFSAPHNPYLEFKLETADRAWQNPQTGNTISYMSDCDGSSDQSLDTLFLSAVEGIENLKISDQRKITFNQREALETSLLGRVDGVGIQVRLIIFKKNNCTFNLSYIGSLSTFMKGYNDFVAFVKEFKVP